MTHKCFLLALLLGCAFGAAAVTAASFTGVVDGEQKSVQLNSFDIQGIAYMSLPALARQIGGTFRVTPARIQVDLAGTSASVGINDTRVDSGRGAFMLRYPIVLRGSDIMIAVADVPPFFSQGLQVVLQGAGDASAAPPDTRVEVQDLSVAEPDDKQVLSQLPAVETAPQPGLPGQPAAPAPGQAAPPQTQPSPAVPEPPASRGPLRTVIIDPGHGGNDTGANGRGGSLEKDITLAVAVRLRDQIKAMGLNAVLTREEDRDLSVRERTNLANQQQGNLLISLHAGASYAPQARGFEVFYPAAAGSNTPRAYIELGRQFAEGASRALAEQTQQPTRGFHAAPLKLMRDAAMPGFLVEMGCLSTAEDEALLTSEQYQIRVAAAVAGALAKAGTGGTAQ